MSITFVIGDVLQKRKALLKREDNAINIDNDEMLAVLHDKESLYFLLGSIPYGNMTIYEYVSYMRSNLRNKPIKRNEIDYLFSYFSFNIRHNKKMKRLNQFEYRMVQIISKWETSIKKILLNMDGVIFNKKNKILFDSLISKLDRHCSLIIGVSDFRFITHPSCILEYNSDGGVNSIQLSVYHTKRAKKAVIRPIINKKEVSFAIKDVYSVIESENLMNNLYN